MKVGQGLVIHTFSKVCHVLVLLLGIHSDNILGSCGLQYKLVEIPGALRNQGAGSYLQGKVESEHSSDWWDYTFSLSSKGYNWRDVIFYCVWVGFLLLITYNILKSCFRRNSWGFARRSGSGSRPGGGGGGGGGGGWFPGDYLRRPPPPYTKNPLDNGADARWTPGFWSGVALGGLATRYWNNNQRQNEPMAYWNQWNQIPLQNPRPSSSRQPVQSNDNVGSGSDLGRMRPSTGIGGSSVR